ncbi:hypothetical protein GCM10020358_42270 [Amorphoplanes nipponensis]|uniref:Uncharacterized protein n=1 Tax=Actinoplanes nipponensis TaxID=135950 RepID=A0A919MMM8_9ACTN|nr:hypothetical protein [Actinoplanes nipponensis]GIE47583.1 hypothetical protein Ani05nite_11170 [Actinoplanes nipponensis]
MIWTGRTDEAAALGSLLDRTYAEAAAAAARPRTLDREFLIGQFDLWATHLLPAVSAGIAPLWSRRAAARAVWRRLGFGAGADHRCWMAGHLAGLGLDAEALLGPERDDRRPVGAPDGRVVPVRQPLTREAAELVRADYDFVGGFIASARIEASSPDDRRSPARSVEGSMDAHLELVAATRRYADRTAPPPVLDFHAPAATSFVFPPAGRDAARLTGPPAVDVTSADVSVEADGVRLTGPQLTWSPGPESAAFSEVEPPPAGPVDVLSRLHLAIMGQLGLMRHAGRLRRWELAAAGALGGGSGAELFRPVPAALRDRAAARRLRALAATEDPLARAFLAHVARGLPLDLPAAAGAVAPPAPARITVGSAGRLLGEPDFTGTRLRLVDVRPDRAVVHLDARRDGRGTIVVIELTEPLGAAPLTVTPDGLTLTRRPALEATADDIALTIPLPGGDWTVRAAAGSWYVD